VIMRDLHLYLLRPLPLLLQTPQCRTRHVTYSSAVPSADRVKAVFINMEATRIASSSSSKWLLMHIYLAFEGPCLPKKEEVSVSEVLTIAVSPRAVTRQLNNINAGCAFVLYSTQIPISEAHWEPSEHHRTRQPLDAVLIRQSTTNRRL
jgi:hypothetical protein